MPTIRSRDSIGQQPMQQYRQWRTTGEGRDPADMANELSGDVIAIIFGFFPPEDIMRMRLLSKKWREAAKKTIVPPAIFRVNSVEKFNAMAAMTTALPNLQQITMCGLGRGQKYIDGEDPYEEIAAVFAHFTTHDINIISNFRKLRTLNVCRPDILNGRYPALFSFPLLHKIVISDCRYLKFDLGMLSSFPLLKELTMSAIGDLTGNLRSLRALKDTLEKVEMDYCREVEGNFMELADFPRLKKLNLEFINVTGDIRDIGEDDFPALRSLCLPTTVCGGIRHQFELISDVPSFMHAIHPLLQRNLTLFKFKEDWRPKHFCWCLSEGSPDWPIDWIWNEHPKPPVYLQFIRAGSRRGWSWCSYDYKDECHSCEINWLDPEPSSESDDYEAYMKKLRRLEQRINFFRGYYEPPTVQQYRRLCEGVGQRD